jgi:hypothetical protein
MCKWQKFSLAYLVNLRVLHSWKRGLGSSSFKPQIINRRGTLWLTTDSINLEYVMRLTSSRWFRQFLKHSTDRFFCCYDGRCYSLSEKLTGTVRQAVDFTNRHVADSRYHCINTEELYMYMLIHRFLTLRNYKTTDIFPCLFNCLKLTYYEVYTFSMQASVQGKILWYILFQGKKR